MFFHFERSKIDKVSIILLEFWHVKITFKKENSECFNKVHFLAATKDVDLEEIKACRLHWRPRKDKFLLKTFPAVAIAAVYAVE